MLNLASVVTGFVSISAFASLACAPAGIKSSAVGTKIFATTAGIKKYQSVLKKKKNKYDKNLLLGKTNLDNFDVLISKDLIISNISHNNFFSVYNVLRK